MGGISSNKQAYRDGGVLISVICPGVDALLGGRGGAWGSPGAAHLVDWRHGVWAAELAMVSAAPVGGWGWWWWGV